MQDRQPMIAGCYSLLMGFNEGTDMKKLIKNNVLTLVIFTMLFLSSSVLHAGDYPEKGDFIKGAKAWAENCTRCHNLRAANELNDDQWITTSFHMRVRGGLSGQETRDILTFLQQSN